MHQERAEDPGAKFVDVVVDEGCCEEDVAEEDTVSEGFDGARSLLAAFGAESFRGS